MNHNMKYGTTFQHKMPAPSTPLIYIFFLLYIDIERERAHKSPEGIRFTSNVPIISYYASLLSFQKTKERSLDKLLSVHHDKNMQKVPTHSALRPALSYSLEELWLGQLDASVQDVYDRIQAALRKQENGTNSVEGDKAEKTEEP